MFRKCKTCEAEKLISDFEKTGSGWRHSCKPCRQAYWRDLYKRNPDRLYVIRRWTSSRKIKNRKLAWEYLRKNPCVDCGECDPIVLEFDHIRGEKRLAVSAMIEGYSWEEVQREIDKCVVRCANCHRRKTAKERKHYAYLELQP